MKTTMNLSDELVEQAMKYTGIKEKTKEMDFEINCIINYHPVTTMSYR